MANGNSRAARSARAKKQLRDKKGRWIEMGRSRLSWYSSSEKKNLSGTAVEAIEGNDNDVIVQTDDGKRHAVATSKVEVIDHKFTLPTEDGDKGITQSQTPETTAPRADSAPKDSKPSEEPTQAPEQAPETVEPFRDETRSVEDLKGLRMDKILDEEYVDKLAEEFRKNGVGDNHVIVEDSPQGEYMSDGHHMLAAAEKAGITEVPTRIFANTPEGRQAALKEIVELEREKESGADRTDKVSKAPGAEEQVTNDAGPYESTYERGDKNANKTHYKRGYSGAYTVAEIDNYNDNELTDRRGPYTPVRNSEGEVLGKGIRVFDKNTGNVVKQNNYIPDKSQITGYDSNQTPKPGESPKRVWNIDELTNEAPEDKKWDTENPIDLSNASSVEDVENALREKFPTLEVNLIAMKDLEDVKSVAKAFDDNIRRYPHLSKIIGNFEASRRLRNATAWVEHYPLENMKQPVSLSVNANETEESVASMYNGDGYFSVANFGTSSSSFDPIMNHEFGHINEEYANVTHQGEYTQSKVADEFDAYLDTLNPYMNKKAKGKHALSEYGISLPAETIAESFAERVEYGDDARPFSKFVTGVMSKWIPELKGTFGEPKNLPDIVRERDNANMSKSKDYIAPEEFTEAVLDGLADGSFLEYGRQAWMKKDGKWLSTSNKPITAKNVMGAWSGANPHQTRFTLSGEDAQGRRNKSVYVDQETLAGLQPGDKILTGYIDLEVTPEGTFRTISDDPNIPARDITVDEAVQTVTVAMTDGNDVRRERSSAPKETTPEPEVEDTTPVPEPVEDRPAPGPNDIRRDLPGAELPEGWSPSAWRVGQPGTVEKETMPKLTAGRGRPPVHRTYYDANGNAMQQGQTVLNKDTGEYVTLGKSRTDTSTDYYDSEGNFVGIISTKKLESLSDVNRDPLKDVNIAKDSDLAELKPNQINPFDVYSGYFRDTPEGARLTTDTGLDYEYLGDNLWESRSGDLKTSEDMANQISNDSHSEWFLDDAPTAPSNSDVEKERREAEARYNALSDEVDKTPGGSLERQAWDSAVDNAMDSYNEDPSLEMYSKEWYDLFVSSYGAVLQDMKDEQAAEDRYGDGETDEVDLTPEDDEDGSIEADRTVELTPEQIAEIDEKLKKQQEDNYHEGLGQLTVPRENSAFTSVPDIKRSDKYQYEFTNDRGEKLTPGLKLWDKDGNSVRIENPLEQGKDSIEIIDAKAFSDAFNELMADPSLTEEEKRDKFVEMEMDDFIKTISLNDITTTPPPGKEWDTTNPINLSSATTGEEVRAIMEQKYPELDVNIGEGDIADIKASVEAFDANVRKFPFLSRAVQMFETENDPDGGSNASVSYYPTIFGASEAIFKINVGHTGDSHLSNRGDPDEVAWAISGSSTSDNPYQGTIDHEFGHLLEYYGKYMDTGYVQSNVLDKVDDYLNTFSKADSGQKLIEKGLSKYGATSGSELIGEAMAELSQKGADARPIAKLVGSVLSESIPELKDIYGDLGSPDQVIKERMDSINAVDKATLPGSDMSERYLTGLPTGTALIDEKGFAYLKQTDGTWKTSHKGQTFSDKEVSSRLGVQAGIKEGMNREYAPFVNKGLFDGLEVGDKLLVGPGEYTYNGNEFGGEQWSNMGGKVVNPDILYAQLRDDPNARVVKAGQAEEESPLDTAPADEVASEDVEETLVPGTEIPRTEPQVLEGEKYAPTRQQQDVIDAVMAGEDTLVQAKAGSGKTSTLEAISRRIKAFRDNEQILYIAFNKSVQVEAKGRMPDNVEPRTGHSLAFQWAPMWMKERMGGGQKGVKGSVARGKKRQAEALRRPDDIADHLGIRDMNVPGLDEPLGREEIAMNAVRTVDRYAYSADDEIGPQHLPESMQGLPQEGQNAVLDAARKAWEDLSSEDGQLKFTFDHSRKHWALTRPDLSNPTGDYVKPAKVIFLDEAQDTPPVLAKVVEDQTVQKVIVGDADQAIYGFTGAVDYLSQADAEVELPLNKSWRFGPQVADIGNRFLQMLKSKGRVVGGGPASKITPEGERMTNADAILTRSNAGMIGEIAKELEAGRTVGVPNGTKADMQRLFNHANDLLNGRTPRNIHEDLAPFRTWKDFQKEVAKDEDPKLKMINTLIDDHGGVEPILRLIDQVIDPAETGGGGSDNDPWHGAKVDPTTGAISGAFMFNKKLKDAGGSMYNAGYRWDGPNKLWVPIKNNPEGIEKAKAGIQAEVDRVFGAPVKPDVTISTAHKAKGLEWGRVRIGDDFKEPKTDENTGKTVMPEPEELRLAYVAVTRAESELDPGSLRWVYDWTDEDGGIPEAEEEDDPIANAPEDTDPAPEQIEDESGPEIETDPDTEEEIDAEDLAEENVPEEEIAPEEASDPTDIPAITKSTFDLVDEDFDNANDGTGFYGDDEPLAIKRDGKWYTPKGREVTNKYLMDSAGMFMEGTFKPADADFPQREADSEPLFEGYTPSELPPGLDPLTAGTIDKDDPDLAIKLDNVAMEGVILSPERNNTQYVYRKNQFGEWELIQVIVGARNRPFNKEDYTPRSSDEMAQAIAESTGKYTLGLPKPKEQAPEDTTPETEEETTPEPEPTTPTPDVTPEPEPEPEPEPQVEEPPAVPEPKTYRIPSARINENTLDLAEEGAGVYNDRNQALAWKQNGKWITRKGQEVTKKQIVDVLKQGEFGVFIFNDPNAPKSGQPSHPSGGQSNGGKATPGSRSPKVTGQPNTVSKKTEPSTGRGRPAVTRTYFDEDGNGYGKNDYVQDTRNGKELRVIGGVTDGSVRVYDAEKDAERTIQTKHLKFLRQGDNDDNIGGNDTSSEPTDEVPTKKGAELVGEDAQGRYFTDISGKKVHLDDAVTFTKKGETFRGKVGYVAPNGTIKVYLEPDFTSYRQIQAHRLKGI